MKVSVIFFLLAFFIPWVSGAEPAAPGYFRGVEYASGEKYREAKGEFERAIKLSPRFTPAREGLKVVEDVLEGRTDPSAASWFFKGIEWANAGGLDEAIAGYTRAIDRKS